MKEILSSKYFLFIFTALLLNIIISAIITKKNNKVKLKTYTKFSIVETIGIIIGAKVLDIIINYDVYRYYMNNKLYINIFTSGFTFFGGIFGAIICIFIYSIISKNKAKELCDVFIPNLILVYSVAKVGCFLNGCCKGISINEWILPIQLIESFIYLVIYIFIIFNSKSDYSKIYLSCILFGTTRFVIEFFREKNDYVYLSISQVFSIFCIILGIRIYYQNKIRAHSKT